MSYFAIEGGVCSGKSSIVALLTQRIDMTILPEYMEMIPRGHPVFLSLLEPDERLRLFFGLEQKRLQLINCEKEIVVGDRCALSIVAFEYAIAKLGHETSLPEFARKSNSLIAIPDAILFLEVDDLLRKKRWANREADPKSLLVENKFNLLLRECFEMFRDFSQLLYVDATNLSLDDLVKYAVSMIVGFSGEKNRRFHLGDIVSRLFL